MKIIPKIFKRIIWIALVAFVASIVFSLLFPARVRVVDSIRMFAQRPIIKWAGKIKMEDIPMIDSQNATAGIDISFEELHQYLNDLTPGSIILTRTRNYVISGFIPSMWMHAGIYLGTKKELFATLQSQNLLMTLDSLMNDSDIYVLDSYSDGVNVRPLKELSNMTEVSYLTHFASFSFNETQEKQSLFIEKGLEYLGREYDYDWITEDDETIFCSELLYHTLQAVGINIKDRTTTVSRIIFTPDNLFQHLLNNSGTGGKFTYHGTVFKEDDTIQILFPM